MGLGSGDRGSGRRWRESRHQYKQIIPNVLQSVKVFINTNHRVTGI